MLRNLFLLLCFGSPVAAETVDVPRLPNGNVDVAAVMSSFKMSNPIVQNARLDEFDGEILGRPFHASYTDAAIPDFFVLTIRSPKLSEEANYLISVILTDAICMSKERRPGAVRWSDTSAQVGLSWKVASSCSAESRP